jgi:hypothetical protein
MTEQNRVEQIRADQSRQHLPMTRNTTAEYLAFADGNCVFSLLEPSESLKAQPVEFI